MNVPKLRFKEFNDEYKALKLSDVAELTSSKRIYLSDYTDNGISFYRGKEISELKSNKPVSDLLYISDEKFKEIEAKYGVPKENDILVTGVGTLGNIYRIPNNIKFYFKDGNLIWLKNIKQNSEYLEYNLEFNKKKLLDSAIGSTQKALTIAELNKLSFCYPSTSEQTKVARTMQLIDIKINLQSKKVEDLKLFKKGLLIKEFNNKKCNNKLKECFDFGKAGGTPKSTNKDYYNGYIPFLSISDMTMQGKYIYYTDKSITEAGLNNSTAWLVPKNSIIISMYASYGLVSINKIDLTTSQAMFNMVINKNYVVEYIYYYLYYLYISNFYNSIVSTGTQSNLNAEQIKLLDIYIPCYNEQKRIYEQFSKIDFKINLEQKKINELLYLKKGLMQNMFV